MPKQNYTMLKAGNKIGITEFTLRHMVNRLGLKTYASATDYRAKVLRAEDVDLTTRARAGKVILREEVTA